MISSKLKKSFTTLIKQINKIDYKKYYLDNNLDKILKTKQFKKIEFKPNYISDNFNKKYEPQILDLIRLHFIIKFMMKWLERRSFLPFVIYRIIVGCLILFLAQKIPNNSKSKK